MVVAGGVWLGFVTTWNPNNTVKNKINDATILRGTVEIVVYCFLGGGKKVSKYGPMFPRQFGQVSCALRTQSKIHSEWNVWSQFGMIVSVELDSVKRASRQIPHSASAGGATALVTSSGLVDRTKRWTSHHKNGFINWEIACKERTNLEFNCGNCSSITMYQLTKQWLYARIDIGPNRCWFPMSEQIKDPDKNCAHWQK